MRHAYMIMAHRNDKTFQALVSMLDYPNNDIFIHMDVKEKHYDEQFISGLCRFSKVFHLSRMNVTWGGASLIRAELNLLEEVLNSGKGYQYLHLLSGQDLPIKTQEYIHNFFLQNNGFEFIGIDSEIFNYEKRIRFFYPLQEYIGRSNNFCVKVYNKINIVIQQVFHVRRNRGINFQKGPNWFSITKDFAKYVVERRNWIERVFANTYCADEIFLQTVFINSPYVDKRFNSQIDGLSSYLRLVDWKRGNPYVWKSFDLDVIDSSPCLYARKFDFNIDTEVIDRISNRYSVSGT